MKVWVAEAVWHWDGSEILGVFDSEEKARRIGEERRTLPLQRSGGAPYKKGDSLLVTELEIE